jgi:hypothetical protein
MESGAHPGTASFFGKIGFETYGLALQKHPDKSSALKGRKKIARGQAAQQTQPRVTIPINRLFRHSHP